MNKYGIDFGTTNSSIAISYLENGVSQTVVVDVEDTMPRIVTPSKVLVTPSGYQVGRTDTQTSNIEMVVRKPKDYLAPQKDYQSSANHVAASPQETIKVGDKNHALVDLIAAVLRKLRLKAEQKIQELDIHPDGVVMGVPVEYGEHQKVILKKALVAAGFYSDYGEADNKTEFVSEPVAVAVDYGLKITDNKNVLVFDFGGGTLDVAIMNLKNDVSKKNRDHLHPHSVLAKEGADIGGEMMTKAFFLNAFVSKGHYSLSEISRAFGISNSQSPIELWKNIMDLGKEGDRFFESIDRLKCDLSSVDRKRYDFMTPYGSLKQVFFSRQDFEMALRKPFEDSNDTVFNQIDKLINRILSNPSIGDNSSIDTVIVAGGSSMIPCIRDYLYDRFTGQLHEKVGQTQALSSIVRGLSLIGCREDTIVDDIVDNDYGFWDVGNDLFCPIVRKGTRVIDTMYAKASGKGVYKEFRNNDPTGVKMDIVIKQRNKYGVTDLGTINLVGTDDRIYRLYMSVDKKLGVLQCYLFDTKDKVWLDDTGMVTRQECQYKLQK